MARGSRSRRDSSHIANRDLLPTPTPSWSLGDVEDRRQWHPEGPRRPARSFSQPRHRLVASPFPSQARRGRASRSGPGRWRNTNIAGIEFFNPSKVLVCVRRQIRREVLTALKKTGKIGQGRPRRSWYSSVRCG